MTVSEKHEGKIWSPSHSLSFQILIDDEMNGEWDFCYICSSCSCTCTQVLHWTLVLHYVCLMQLSWQIWAILFYKPHLKDEKIKVQLVTSSSVHSWCILAKSLMLLKFLKSQLLSYRVLSSEKFISQNIDSNERSFILTNKDHLVSGTGILAES